MWHFLKIKNSGSWILLATWLHFRDFRYPGQNIENLLLHVQKILICRAN